MVIFGDIRLKILLSNPIFIGLAFKMFRLVHYIPWLPLSGDDKSFPFDGFCRILGVGLWYLPWLWIFSVSWIVLGGKYLSGSNPSIFVSSILYFSGIVHDFGLLIVWVFEGGRNDQNKNYDWFLILAFFIPAKGG